MYLNYNKPTLFIYGLYRPNPDFCWILLDLCIYE